jgi:hypothetical protein
MTAHGSINLIPLVDILTSIVFFSLLTYTGAALAALTSFDLVLPPVVVTTPEQSRNNTGQDVQNLLVGVGVFGWSVGWVETGVCVAVRNRESLAPRSGRAVSLLSSMVRWVSAGTADCRH